jgi:Rad3-related DNA helicase
MKIKKIKKIDYKEDVYNLHIQDNHNYFANNHCVSNCHELDSVISDFISIKITENIIKKLKFTNEKKVISALKKVTNISEYISFLKFLKIEIDETFAQITNELEVPNRTALSDKRENKISKVLGSKNPDVKLMNILSDLSNYSIKIKLFLEEYEENTDNWVIETYYNETTKQKELSLEPIWSQDYLEKYLWSKYDTVILMSGTILNKELFCDVNGIEVDKAVYYSIPSPFDVDKRKIFYMPLGKMSWEKKEETFKNYLEYLPKILKKYPDKKGIIHTNSFELSNWIQKGLKNKRLVFHDSDNKNEVLQEHYKTQNPTVIVSPSMSTGVSFDHDKARFQVVAKIPYPSLGSQKNKMRKQQNPAYYSWKTCAGVIQMCGRVVRSGNDWADTIIIDGSFGDVMKYSSHFLPNWFLSSVRRVDVKK